jgi:hypothetical protein
MKLAMKLGRTLEELALSMSAHEFGLWLALYDREPWDDTRGDYQAGIIASTVVNFGGRTLRKGAKPLSPLDFMPLLNDDPTPEEEEESGDPMAHFYQISQKP